MDAYFDAALWATQNAETYEFLDEMGYSQHDFSSVAKKQIRAECEYFIVTYGAYFEDERYVIHYPLGCGFLQAAHDLFLTRNGYGAGFNDGNWLKPAAKILTDASERMGAFDIEIGDDGRLHI